MSDYNQPVSKIFAHAEYPAIQSVHFALFGGNIRRKKQELLLELEEIAREEGDLMTILIHDAIYYRNTLSKISAGKDGIEKGSQLWFSTIGRVTALERILENFRKRKTELTHPDL